MEHIIQIQTYTHPIRYDDGEIARYRVRIVKERGATKPSQIIVTGRTFETISEAELYAHGLYCAFRVAKIETAIEYVEIEAR